MSKCEHLKKKIKGAHSKKARGKALQRFMQCKRGG